jgi:isopentenyl-diphosphate delta-isomerase
MTKVVVVDQNDQVVGAMEKEKALKKGLIRRIARVFVFNDQGQLYMQKRSPSMLTYPNTWDQSAGGHVDEGESYETAAARELEEELGIKGVKLEKVSKFYIEEREGKRLSRQFNCLFTTSYNGEITLDKEEISGGRWFSFEEIDQMIKDDPSQFPPGFLRAYEEYENYILDRDDREKVERTDFSQGKDFEKVAKELKISEP